MKITIFSLFLEQINSENPTSCNLRDYTVQQQICIEVNKKERPQVNTISSIPIDQVYNFEEWQSDY